MHEVEDTLSTKLQAAEEPALPISNCLLVDDREDNLIALGALLSDLPIQMFKALSGHEALELLLEQEFALALIDVNMPGMSGFELAELMRGTTRTRSIPIIFVTAATDDVHGVFKGYEAGAVDFLVKPLNASMVRSKVRVFLELFQQRQRLRWQLDALRASELAAVQALAARNRFTSMASHELRTPLSVLGLQVTLNQRRLAADGFLKGDVASAMLDTMQRQVTRLIDLVDEMLDVTRIESGNLSIRPARCNLSALVIELVERLAPILAEAGCRLSLDCEETLWGTWDAFRLEQVLANLLTNAARYGAGTPVSVSARSCDIGAELSVSDQGAGIDPDHLERIFLPFERAEEDQGEGLGLGLHIARHIVEMHGGQIDVVSELGGGSTFIVRLPLAPPQ